MLLIGSQALKLRYPHLLDHGPRDADFICEYSEFQDLVRKLDPFGIKAVYPVKNGNKLILNYYGFMCEFEIAWEETTAKALLDSVGPEYLTEERFRPFHRMYSVSVPNLEILFMLKASHRFFKNSPHFLKTMKDYTALKNAGAKIPDHFKDWFKAREKETYNYPHPNLNQSKKDFFKGDGITYVYDHDTIHLAMALNDKPAYTYFKKPGSEVLCDRGLFEAAPFEIQMASVMEESYVLALERSQIPFQDPPPTPEWSFKKALEKVCTSITSGWWRAWAYDHYYNALDMYDPNYVKRFWMAVDDGIVVKL